jgi:hypothetical protein
MIKEIYRTSVLSNLLNLSLGLKVGNPINRIINFAIANVAFMFLGGDDDKNKWGNAFTDLLQLYVGFGATITVQMLLWAIPKEQEKELYELLQIDHLGMKPIVENPFNNSRLVRWLRTMATTKHVLFENSTPKEREKWQTDVVNQATSTKIASKPTIYRKGIFPIQKSLPKILSPIGKDNAKKILQGMGL